MSLRKKIEKLIQPITGKYQIILKNGKILDEEDYEPLASLVQKSARIREQYQRVKVYSNQRT